MILADAINKVRRKVSDYHGGDAENKTLKDKIEKLENQIDNIDKAKIEEMRKEIEELRSKRK